MGRVYRTLYFSAFQSHLWNLFLAGWLERSTRPDQRVPIELKAGTFPFPRRPRPRSTETLIGSLDSDYTSSRNPLPTGPLRNVVDDVLEQFQLTWSGLRVKHLKDVFFSKGARASLVFPENLEFHPIEDDLYPGRRGLSLSFELGKGSYATIMIKRITETSKRVVMNLRSTKSVPPNPTPKSTTDAGSRHRTRTSIVAIRSVAVNT